MPFSKGVNTGPYSVQRLHLLLSGEGRCPSRPSGLLLHSWAHGCPRCTAQLLHSLTGSWWHTRFVGPFGFALVPGINLSVSKSPSQTKLLFGSCTRGQPCALAAGGSCMRFSSVAEPTWDSVGKTRGESRDTRGVTVHQMALCWAVMWGLPGPPLQHSEPCTEPLSCMNNSKAPILGG